MIFKILFSFLFFYLLARIVGGVFRAVVPRRGEERSPAPDPADRSPLAGAEIEDADWEEIEESKGDSG